VRIRGRLWYEPFETSISDERGVSLVKSLPASSRRHQAFWLDAAILAAMLLAWLGVTGLCLLPR
jgi:hypothetical protein